MIHEDEVPCVTLMVLLQKREFCFVYFCFSLVLRCLMLDCVTALRSTTDTLPGFCGSSLQSCRMKIISSPSFSESSVERFQIPTSGAPSTCLSAPGGQRQTTLPVFLWPYQAKAMFWQESREQVRETGLLSGVALSFRLCLGRSEHSACQQICLRCPFPGYGPEMMP